MAKQPIEEQPQAMESMDATTQPPDPIAGAQSDIESPMAQEPQRGSAAPELGGPIGTTREQNAAAKRHGRMLRDQKESIAELDRQAASRESQTSQAFREDAINRGGLPESFAQSGDVLKDTRSVQPAGSSGFIRVDEGQAEAAQGRLDAERTQPPDLLERPPGQPPELLDRDPDNFVETTTQQREEAAAQQAEKQAQQQKADRQAEADEKNRRSNALATERARKRRGLPPLDQEARVAVDGGGAGMSAFRERPMSPPAPSIAKVSDGPAVSEPERPEGGYQTGQEVQLKDMSGGQQSTKVYALDNGIALPDGQGMSNEDFLKAFEQVNPGKGPVDAIQAISRMPGARGNAARKILRDIGATGGGNLTPTQKQQIQDVLSGRSSDLLRGFAREMAGGIGEGATAIARKRESDKTKQRQDRSDALKRARERREKDPEGTAGMSDEQLVVEEMKAIDEDRQFVETGKGLATEAPPPPDVEGIYEVGDEMVTNPAAVPVEAMPPNAKRDESGELYFDLGTNRLPAVLVPSTKNPSGQQVVPVVRDASDARRLPPGTSYVLDGRFHDRGTPGRPSKDDGDKPKTRAQREAGGRPDYDRSAVRRDLEKKAQAQTKEQLEPIQELIRQSQSKVASQNADLRRAEEQGLSGEQLFTIEQAVEAAESELKTQQEKLTAAQERIGVDLDISQEDISNEIARREGVRVEDVRYAEEDAFRRGDPEAVARSLQDALPENAQIVNTAEGEQMVVGDVGVPVYRDTNGQPVIISTNVQQAAALEANSRGFVPVGYTGGNAQDVALNTLDQRDLYQGLVDVAEKDKMFFDNASEEEQKRFYTEKLKPYVQNKYKGQGFSSQEMREVENAVLESLFGGFYR